MKDEQAAAPLSEMDIPFPPERIWILGAGRFGTLAAERLNHRFTQARLLVVDVREDRLERLHQKLALAVHVEDSVSFLIRSEPADDQWIIPAVPIHVAFQWLLRLLNEEGKVQRLPVPLEVDGQVPNPYRMPGGTLYASYATFRCPDFCSEPDEMCTYTQKPRTGRLYETLSHIAVDGYGVEVIRSWQLAPGVGGYPAKSLRNGLEKIRRRGFGTFLVATSCLCHGVIDALRWEGRNFKCRMDA